VFLRDTSRSIIARNDSPDVGFDASINPYRGCEHGCIYCYARPYHEYLGLSSGLDFETKILVKENAPELLRRELTAPGWKPEVLGISGVTDPYQPIERQLRLTRGCLEVLAEFRNPVRVITKNHLVTRDADLLSELAGHHAAGVFLSVTTLDEDLRRVMEPRTATAAARLEAIRILSASGVPTGVMVAPIIPGLNDHEVPAILSAAATAGALFAGYTIVRLPYAVKDLFVDWLALHLPDRKEKVLAGIRSLRAGKLNDSRFGSRMRGEGARADIIKRMFRIACKKAGIPQANTELSTAAFRRSGPPVLFPI
jgi:DNA repair photolyase